MGRSHHDPDRLGGVRLALPFMVRWFFGFDRRRSLVTLIYLAMLADGHESPEEREETFALMDRTRTLRGLPRPKAQALLERVAKDATKRSRDELLEKASRCFRERGDLAKSVFMHVADIVLADRALVESEEKFVEQLAHALQLDEKEAAALFLTLRVKDKF